MNVELNDLLKTKIDDKKMQVLLETLREIEKSKLATELKPDMPVVVKKKSFLQKIFRKKKIT